MRRVESETRGAKTAVEKKPSMDLPRARREGGKKGYHGRGGEKSRSWEGRGAQTQGGETPPGEQFGYRQIHDRQVRRRGGGGKGLVGGCRTFKTIHLSVWHAGEETPRAKRCEGGKTPPGKPGAAETREGTKEQPASPQRGGRGPKGISPH